MSVRMHTYHCRDESCGAAFQNLGGVTYCPECNGLVDVVDGERILCAAIHVDDGKQYPHQPVSTGLVFGGHRHHNINVAARQFTMLRSRAEGWGPNTLRALTTQGFLTTTGRFVDRQIAMKIAREAGQVTSTSKDELYSEDLY